MVAFVDLIKARAYSRHPAGSSKGGQFAPKGGGGGGATPDQVLAQHAELAEDVGRYRSPGSALTAYIGPPGFNINAKLRGYEGGRLRSSIPGMDDVSAAIDTKYLDEMISKSTLGKTDLFAGVAGSETQLYRATRAQHFGKDFASIKVGDRLQNHAFVSTSKGREFPADWIKDDPGGREGSFLMHITTQKSSHGIDVVSTMRRLGEKQSKANQQAREVILGRRSSFRVDRIEPAKDGGFPIVHVTHFDPPSFNEPFHP